MESAFEKLKRDLTRDEEAQAAQAAASEAVDVPAGLKAVPAAPVMSASVVAGIAAGNINFSSGAAAQKEVDQHESLLDAFEKRKQARSIVVPTDDNTVKLQLRSYEQPICLFGEDPADRRERLKELLTKLGPEGKKRAAEQEEDDAGKETAKVKEVWYHAGPPELAELRKEVAGYSLRRAKDRLSSARVRLSLPDAERNPGTAKLHNQVRQFGNYSSQVGDTRPLTFCEFNPNGDMLATSSWTGLCKLWSVPDCKEVKTLRGHTERVGAVSWHPASGISQDPAGVNLVSCDAAGAVKCWSMESDEPIATLDGHSKRVPRIAFHPNGQLLGTTCYDHSWRLWDMNTQKEMLHQEGHSRPVYSIAFHPDGSLVCTGGEDALGRIWDLRSGKCILTLEGHVKKVLGCDFSANGYHVATGSEDHTMRLWDLRQKKSVYTMPSHKGLISHIKYQKDGELLVSASFDGTAKVWAMPACTQLKELKGHEGKLAAVDVSRDSKYIVSASHDRTFKLWAAE